MDDDAISKASGPGLPDPATLSGWRARWIAGITEGLAEADRGEFATEEEVAKVLSRHSAA